MPLVSLGLPVYNGAKFLAAALDCLLAQTFEDFEVLVSDNASTDGTAEIVREHAARDRRVRYHRNDRNLGAAPNFNLVFRMTSGKYFKWVAYDDLCRPELLQACVDALESDPSLVLAFTAIHIVDEMGRFVEERDELLRFVDNPRPSVRFADLILADHFCYDIFGMIRREVLERTPLIAPYIGSDRNLLAELGLWGRYHHDPRPLFMARDHPDRSAYRYKLRERAEWFDPKLSGKLAFPYFRYFYEYGRSVLRVPMSVRERAACCRALGRWGVVNRHGLRADVEHAAQRLRHRGSKRSPSPS